MCVSVGVCKCVSPYEYLSVRESVSVCVCLCEHLGFSVGLPRAGMQLADKEHMAPPPHQSMKTGRRGEEEV